MENIYIFGHKKPDTDSVTAAIALSYLKNKLGMNTIPRILGNPNNETKFVLDYFKVNQPEYLNDVKLQIKDLNYLKDYYMGEHHSIFEGFKYMNENIIGTLPIVDDNNKFLGIVSLKDIAKMHLHVNDNKLNTSYNNILKTIQGGEILKFNDEISGNILIASKKSSTFIENTKLDSQSILIVGDRNSIIEYAVNSKVKLIILTSNSNIKDEHLKIAKENNINIIKTELDTFNTVKIIQYSNYLKELLLTNDVVCFNEDEDVNDFIDITNKRKFSNYPILNKNNECLGLARLSDINDKKRKKVILVDHNESNQSADGLDEAEIVEIVDHHKIGTIGTSMPINFRNMPVGSTNTIIYMLYKENNIEIPRNIAGLMLSGIISDTLLFKSPTTTEIDKVIVKDLAEIANVNYEEYGLEMLKAGSSLKGKTKEEILYSDFKNFTINDKKVGVGQITTFNIDEIMNEKDEYIELINNIAKNNDYHIVALFATDILTNGSYIFYNDDASDILDNSFNTPNIKQGYYLEGIVSRKKQIIPNIIDALEKK